MCGAVVAFQMKMIRAVDVRVTAAVETTARSADTSTTPPDQLAR